MNVRKWTECFVAGLAVVLLLTSTLAAQDKDAKGTSDQKKAAESIKGDAAKGGKLFEDKCALCHEAKSEEAKVGPGLKGLFKKPPHEVNGKQHAHSVDSIREQILKGSAMMPPMEQTLSEQEVNDLLAYLQTL